MGANKGDQSATLQPGGSSRDSAQEDENQDERAPIRVAHACTGHQPVEIAVDEHPEDLGQDVSAIGHPFERRKGQRPCHDPQQGETQPPEQRRYAIGQAVTGKDLRPGAPLALRAQGLCAQK